MLFFKNFSFRLPLAALALAALVLPLAAGAQEAPEPGVIPVPGAVPGDVQPYPPSVQAPQAPYYAPPPVYASQDETIHGRIQSIEGTFNLTFADDRGFLDNVVLRQGTIINPTGLTLAPGMAATIIGFASGNAFNANEIDTPYTYSGPAPTPAYYGAGWWYPGYAYGYGPSFSLALFFGSGGGWYVQPCAWGGRGYTYQPIYGWNPNYPVAYHGPMNNLPRYGQQAFPQGNPQQVGLHTGPGTSPGSPGQGGPPQNGHGAPGNTPGQPGQFGPPGTGRTAPGNPAPGQSGPPEQVIGHLGPGNSTPPGNAPGNVNPPGYAHTGSNGNPWQRFGSSGGSAYQSPSGGGYARVPSPSYDHAVRYNSPASGSGYQAPGGSSYRAATPGYSPGYSNRGAQNSYAAPSRAPAGGGYGNAYRAPSGGGQSTAPRSYSGGGGSYHSSGGGGGSYHASGGANSPHGR